MEGGDRSDGGQRGMEGLCRQMCRLAEEGVRKLDRTANSLVEKMFLFAFANIC